MISMMTCEAYKKDKCLRVSRVLSYRDKTWGFSEEEEDTLLLNKIQKRPLECRGNHRVLSAVESSELIFNGNDFRTNDITLVAPFSLT